MNHALTITDRIMATLDGLYAAVAGRSRISVLAGRGTGVLAGWLITLVCQRIRRTEGRILRMLARFRAGRLVVRPDGVGERAGRPAAGGRTRPSAGRTLPRRLAWLLPLVPCEAANFASQFRLTLADPEMAALLRASPQARRVLAPLCRMLGIAAAALTPEPQTDAGSDQILPVRGDEPIGSGVSRPSIGLPAPPGTRMTAAPDG